MTPKEFEKQWISKKGNLNKISPSRLVNLGLSKPIIEFISISGLPNDAPPFLSFGSNTDDKYRGIHKLTKIYDFLEPGFDKYVVIGSCSDGDPIVINTLDNEKIEYLDHEDYFSPRFFNTSIISMAKSLLAYRDFVNNLLVENGEDAYLNCDFSDSQFEKLKHAIKKADNQTYANEGFWKIQLDMDLEMREDIQNRN
ncbi:SUKH-4 family immunity protein [Spongiimicrobium sp. 2-473A-2-J]|uniref:SUKH-4 family immunity protein n=1 Tax=Eudoraea algarum TaxID=3417568 RepID=UPI003D367601